MKCSIFIAASIDGFIATEDGGVEWLEGYDNPDGSDYGYGAFIREIDALIIGRGTYEAAAGFAEWPYALPVYVLSGVDTIDPRVTFVRGGVHAALAAAAARGHDRFYVDGGKTIQSFLEADLIDEMIITTIPVILGSGIPLFGSHASTREFELRSTQRVGPFAQSRFVRRGDPATGEP